MSSEKHPKTHQVYGWRMFSIMLSMIMLGACSFVDNLISVGPDPVAELEKTIAAGQTAQTMTQQAQPTVVDTQTPTVSAEPTKTTPVTLSPTTVLSPTPTFSWLVGPAATAFITETLTPAPVRTPPATAPFSAPVGPIPSRETNPIAAATWTPPAFVPYEPATPVPEGNASPSTLSPQTTATSAIKEVTVPEWSWELVNGQIVASGTVLNASSRAMSYVRVNILMTDDSGAFLATAGTYADAVVIQPGETSSWSLQTKAPTGLSDIELSDVITWQWYESPA